MGGTIISQDIIKKQYSLNEVRSMIIIHNGEKFSYYDEGCTRFVFINDDESLVIKIDKTKGDNTYNQKEIDIYENSNDEDKLLMTPTRMVGGIIEQDFCEPIKYGGKRLSMEQVRFASSCRNEVGWDKDGNLVCFDLDEFKKY